MIMDAAVGNVEPKVAKREGVEQNGCLEMEDDKKKKKGGGGGGGGGPGKKGSSSSGSGMKCCQAEKCDADLFDAKQYHRRHKVCEFHAKAQVVIVAGMRQRFCQQCSRFQELAEFDDTKRSCRKRLAGHNERRRKNSESQAEGLSRKGTCPELKNRVFGQVDDRRSIHVTIQENAAYKISR